MYSVRFFTDIVNHHQTPPAKLHDRTFPTIYDAEEFALDAMPSIRNELGPKAGYAIIGSEGHVWQIGPGATWRAPKAAT
jgi:hypothetical protein